MGKVGISITDYLCNPKFYRPNNTGQVVPADPAGNLVKSAGDKKLCPYHGILHCFTGQDLNTGAGYSYNRCFPYHPEPM